MSTYESGDGFALVGASGSMLLAAGCESRLIEALWETVSGPTRVEDVLRALLVTSDVGSLPDFALVVPVPGGDQARAVVRGGFEVVADEAAAERTVTADASNMWTEAVVAPLDGVVLRPVESTASGAGLPIGEGVVRAASVRWTRGSRAGAPSATGVDGALRAAPPAEPARGHEHEPARPPAITSNPVTTETVVPDLDATLAPEEVDDASTQVEAFGQSEVVGAPSPLSASRGLEDSRHEDQTTTYDHLISGATRALTVEDAAVRADDDGDHRPATSRPAATPDSPPPAPATSSVTGSPSAVLGDHDGLTVSAEQLAALQSQSAGAAVPDSSSQAPILGSGLIAGIPGRASAVLVLPTGERHTLDRGAVVGTRPSAVRASGTLPHLIAVASPNGEISRRHLELRVTGDHVQAVDLDSTNGTRLLRVGADPLRLQPGVTALLIEGDRLDLGDQVVLAFEGLG